MPYGVKVTGELKPHYVEKLGEDNGDNSVPGKIYQFDIDTEGFSIDQEQQIVAQLLTLEETTADLKITCIEATNDKRIMMQFTDTGPNSFSFIALMGTVPVILGLILVVVVAYALWTVYKGNEWILGLFIVGAIGVGFFFFTQGKISLPDKDIFSSKEDKKASEVAAKEGSKRAKLESLEKIITSYEGQIVKLEKQLADVTSSPPVSLYGYSNMQEARNDLNRKMRERQDALERAERNRETMLSAM
jgi:exonuclease VII small subunit